MRIPLLVLVLGLCAHAESWPFGAGPMFQKWDLYNLGILGAKASDAAKPPPATKPMQSGRRAVQMDRPSNDDGPEQLRIELLLPGGPAEKAGLRRGDVLVGVGAKKFTKGSLAPLAKALLKAEAGKGELTLLVKRDGKSIKIKAQVVARGKPAAKPTQGAGRRLLVDAALEWLAGKQDADGGFPQTLSGKNGAVVQTSLAGLAWVGAGNDLKSGKYSGNVRRAAHWVAANVRDMASPVAGRGGASWNQSNWGWAHAAIFLGELHARTPDATVLAGLQYCAGRLLQSQEQSGGWAHGPGGKNALGYLELNIVTGLALGGLGLAHQNGVEISPDAIDRAEQYLKDSSSGGGVGYSSQPGQRGQGNIGRTAAAWLGYLALGRGKSKWAKSMGAFVRREVDNALGGHASLMQHIMLAGVAAHALGGAVEKAYWKAMERDLVLAHTPDGSFQPRPWHESISMGSNSDVSVGEVWTTAAWTVVLVSKHGKDGFPGFPAWFGR